MTETRPLALITGGARRVGRAISLALAKAGCDILIHYNTSHQEAIETALLVENLGARAKTLQADLSDPKAIEGMFDQIRASFGHLAILVNNAAIFKRTPPWDLTEEDLDEHLQINLKAPYLCSIHAAKMMGSRQGGCIINIADVAWERPFRNHIPYCISKAGLVMMTRAMAKAFAPKIRVNAVAPGTVLFRPDEDEAMRRAVIARIPRGQIGTPEDVASAVVFLAFSPHITGAVLPVDGGRSLA